jgi:hypothetical protein
MNVRDDINYSRWEAAAKELKLRQEFYEAAQVFPETHALRMRCKEKLDEAQAAYDKVVGELQ